MAERTVNPYALLSDNGVWYLVGHDLDRDAARTFRVSRIRGEIRLATRRERDFRLPEDFDVEEYRVRPPWQIGEPVGEARIEVGGDTAWWLERVYGQRGRLENGTFVTEYASLPLLASWILRQDGRAVPVEPAALRKHVAEGLRRVRKAHEGKPPDVAPEAEPGEARQPERPAGPVAPERFGLLQSLLAYLLDRCGDERRTIIPARELVDRFHIPPEALEEHLALLNLVNFGGGCYAVYAQLHGDEVHVEKELFGETFRSPPRLTPLEARAIRLALEFVGPMIAADAHTPLDRVRRKLEDTFGAFKLAQTPEPHVSEAEESLVGTLSAAIREQRLVSLEYQKEGEETPSRRLVEPYSIERRLPHWYVHTWDRTSGGERSFRLDRMRSARLRKERFRPREGFDPRSLRDARRARILYSPDVARWQVERGARLLADGSALAETAVGSPEWLVGEILSFRGEAVVLEPVDLRSQIASRAKQLAQEVPTARVV
jgi:proteasome accessory factor BC